RGELKELPQRAVRITLGKAELGQNRSRIRIVWMLVEPSLQPYPSDMRSAGTVLGKGTPSRRPGWTCAQDDGLILRPGIGVAAVEPCQGVFEAGYSCRIESEQCQIRFDGPGLNRRRSCLRCGQGLIDPSAQLRQDRVIGIKRLQRIKLCAGFQPIA